jgi:hypothetical protein
MQVRVLDYSGEQDVWATSAKPDGKLAQVKLKDGNSQSSQRIGVAQSK